MNRLFVPSRGPADWKRFLADPDKQWRTGYSAKSLAACWEAANGLPSEIAELLSQATGAPPSDLELLVAFPEWKVALPGGQRESQNDVFALVRAGSAVVSVAVEGKVNEPFGPTLEDWYSNPSAGKKKRLEYLLELLGLEPDIPGTIRYQLLHRTTSAAIEMNRFGTESAAMLVHSFSQESVWFDDFAEFAGLFGIRAEPGIPGSTRLPSGELLYLGWAKGESRFLEE